MGREGPGECVMGGTGGYWAGQGPGTGNGAVWERAEAWGQRVTACPCPRPFPHSSCRCQPAGAGFAVGCVCVFGRGTRGPLGAHVPVLAPAGMPPGKGQMSPLLPSPKVSVPTPPGTPEPRDRGCAQAPKGPGSPAGRCKKKSRKHQRFMERRAVLEQKGLLSPRRCPGTQSPQSGLEEHSTFSKANGSSAPRRDKVPKATRTVSSSLSPSASPDSIARHHSVLLCPGSGSSTRVPMSSLVLPPAKCVAIDCEMVGTGPQGRLSELARCSVVNYQGDVVYDKYVQPELPIVDYRTRWSGITKQHMKNAIPFKTAQAEVRKKKEEMEKKKKNGQKASVLSVRHKLGFLVACVRLL